ncbi:follistatin-related protein 5-like [Tachypleus tridentatus]|uniref:follistatin-related protein 5-like n=1 Tax=Tachypleus tridentatus TaxID=6853 RepID=UPI003FD5115B
MWSSNLVVWLLVSSLGIVKSRHREIYGHFNENRENQSLRTNFKAGYAEKLGDESSCNFITCGRGQQCVVREAGHAVCACRLYCKHHNKPVCGTDGKFYGSHCELHRTACLLGKTIRIDRKRGCLVKRKKLQETTTEDHTFITVKGKRTDTPVLWTNIPKPEFTGLTTTPKPKQETKATECTKEEYDILKENILLLNYKEVKEDKKSGKENEHLVSSIFSHYDQNNNGFLEAEELWQAGEHDRLARLSSACIIADMLLYDDTNNDGKLNINEFYHAFNVSVITLDKSLEINHVIARVGDNVEIKCDISGIPPPPIVWQRNNLDLSILNEEGIKVFVDGSLYLTNVQLVYGGNYTCYAQWNKEVFQTHILHVHTLPEVHIIPKLQSRSPGEFIEIECHVAGVPTPNVSWLKNDYELKDEDDKYTIVGNGTALLIGKVTYSDTGAYMCVASNPAGSMRDISSLVVQDQPTPTAAPEERRFFAFHDWGVSVYDPDNCRLYHQMQSTDIIPGTQEYVCGDRGIKCSWGRAINVANRYVYVSQPTKDRILIISRVQMVVVDVVVTDKYPVDLYYVPHLDQIWLTCWRSSDDRGTKTIQIIRDASQKRKHHTVHPEPVDGHFDLVSELFIPLTQDFRHPWKYGFAVHTNQRGMYKLQLKEMKYVKTVDLTPYNCAPRSAAFAAVGGYIILECIEPITHRPTGQLVLDYLTDIVVSHKINLFGKPHISPDSRYVVTLERTNTSVIIFAQEVTEQGLQFLFDVKTTLQISDITYFPSPTTQSYDLYASSSNKEDILFVDLANGKVEMVTGIGQAMGPEVAEWKNTNRPMTSAGIFGTYMVTTANEAIFVVNGKTRTVNCEIGNIIHPRLMVWVKSS